MTDDELKQMAIEGNKQIENAIMELLKNHPYGLSNQDIVEKLSLSSSHEGGQTNFQKKCFSSFQNLMEKGKVLKDKSGTRPKYKLI